MKIKIGIKVLLCIFAVSLSAQRVMSDTVERLGSCVTPGVPWGVYVSNHYGYVATRGGLAVVDVLDPTNPNMTDYIDNFYISALGVVVTDTVAVLNADLIGRLTNINVTNPESLDLLGWCFTNSCSGLEPKGISVLNNIAYQAIGNCGFWIVDITNPDTPVVIDSFNTPGIVVDLFVKDTLVYIADHDSLQIVNVVASPFRVGALAMPNRCYDVFVIDTFAYVVCQSSYLSGTDGSLQVVNVSNPASPQIITSVNNLTADPFDIWISGDYAYVAAADFWFPLEGKRRQVGGLRPEWTYGKRADIEGGLRVVDISNPVNPTLAASYDTPGDPRGVFAVDTLVFIADYDSLQILKHNITGIKEADNSPYVGGIALRLQPNPCSKKTIIHYQLPFPGNMSLEIFDITGRLIKTFFEGHKEAGVYTIKWDGRDRNDQTVPNGIYLCYLKTQSSSLIQKLIVTK